MCTAGTLTRRGFRDTLPELGFAELGFDLTPARADALVDAMVCASGGDAVNWKEFLVR
eukprot:COSAG06_NODE_65751_length_256_cov_0.656051_1_plen_57_part_01